MRGSGSGYERKREEACEREVERGRCERMRMWEDEREREGMYPRI
jgi:hypothetical protein